MQTSPSSLLSSLLAAALSLNIFLPVGASAAPRIKKGRVAPPQVNEKTQVRASIPVFLVSKNSRGAELKHLNVEVRNVGRHPAKGVSVFVDIGGGLMTQLRGAVTLAPGQSGLFMLRSRLPIVQIGPVRIVSSCANCRR